MTYTFEEFQKLKEQHNKEFDVREQIPSDDMSKAVQTIRESMEQNADSQVFTLTRPIVTLETFRSDLKLFNYLYVKCPDIVFTFLPETGYFAFFRDIDAKKKFDDNDLWRHKEMRDYKTVKLYTGGAELVREDGTTDYVVFDKIKV